MIHKSVFDATGQAALRSGSNILTRGIAEGTGGAIQYNADLLARNIAFGENNKLDFASDEARKQFVLSFAIGAVAEVPHAFGSFPGYKAGYSNLDMYQRAADGLWEYENNNKLTVEQLGKSGIIDDRTPETLVAQEIADSRMKSMGIEGAGSLKSTPELESHINYVDTSVPRNRGIGGAHNSTEFFKNDVNIIKSIPSKDISGVTYHQYSMPKLGPNGKPVGGYGTKVYEKTVFNPKIISPDEYIQRGLEAANNSFRTNGTLGRQWEGYDSHGVKWIGFSRGGEPFSFFPDIPKQ